MNGHGQGPLDRLGLTDEAKLFVRMAAFGLLVGGGYGLLTGETAGIVLLVAFGLASAVAAIAIIVGSRRPSRTLARHNDAVPGSSAATGPVPGGRPSLPAPGWAPIEIGIGLGGLALGGAFGPWLAIAGLLVALIGAKGWLDAVNGDAATGGEGDEPAADRPTRRDHEEARD